MNRQTMTQMPKGVLTPLLLLLAILGVNGLYLVSVTLLEWYSGQIHQDYFYQLMFLGHLLVGLIFIPPLLLFGFTHIRRSLGHENRRAMLYGSGFFLALLLLSASGLLITRFEFLSVMNPDLRSFGYWLHILLSFLILPLFLLHRLVGARRLNWHYGRRIGFAVLLLTLLAGVGAIISPNSETLAAADGELQSLAPSLARTADGRPIAPELLMMDEYCRDCHRETHETWQNSVHRFSSFNNPAYRFSVRELRELWKEKTGTVDAVRFCAGCHDPVPLFSGRLTRDDFDDMTDFTASAGLTCSACHAISAVNSLRGNGDYTITAPVHYPFTFTDNPVLKAINHQLIKAKPELHKKTFMQPFQRSAEFCSVCHKVFLPEEVNGYKWLRGQNHYDSFMLSGVSGHGVSSFYYPPHAIDRCQVCHMSPMPAREDFGALNINGDLKVHDHTFAAANTGLFHLLGMPDEVNEPRRLMLKEALRVDIFGLREEGEITGKLMAPLKPRVPMLEPGKSYLLEVVLRTLRPGHLFTQGTSDSNQIWVALAVRQEGELISQNGAMDAEGRVDPWSHFVNAYVLDKQAERVDRRNGQDIVAPLYDHQIPPGAADVLHYRLDVPADAKGSLQVEARLNYRKFDTTYLQYIQGEEFAGNDLPITLIASDRIEFPVASGNGEASVALAEQPAFVDEWERWNDYGIGLLRKPEKRGLGRAEQAFQQVETLGRAEGALNLARVYLAEGRLDEAGEALRRARDHERPAYPWSVAWFAGLLNKQLGQLDEAIENFRALVETRFIEARERGFDFSRDYRLLNELGQTLFERAKQEQGASRQMQRNALLQEAREWFEKTLTYDEENATAHYNLALIHRQLGDGETAQQHHQLHIKYKADDNVQERILTRHRLKYPAADHAAESVVIYGLRSPGESFSQAPGG